MSLEITLYTKSATKQKLIDELFLHDFYRANGIFDSLNDGDGFMWFETKNYESFVGVEANIRKATKEERENSSGPAGINNLYP